MFYFILFISFLREPPNSRSPPPLAAAWPRSGRAGRARRVPAAAAAPPEMSLERQVIKSKTLKRKR